MTHLVILKKVVITTSGSTTCCKVGGNEKSDTRGLGEGNINANTPAPVIQVFSQHLYFETIPTIVE